MIFNSKNTFLIVHKTLEFALEIPEESFERKCVVELGPINENNNKQLWLLEGKSSSNVEIVNGFSDYCLTEEGENLSLRRGTGKKDQSWAIEFPPNGSGKNILIKLAKSKNKYLGVHSGELHLKEVSSQSPPEVWTLVEVVGNQMLKTSCFIISSDAKKLIDIPEASKKEGEEVCIYEPNYRYNQRWNLFKAGEIYVIKSFYNKYNLDVQGAHFENDTPIIQYLTHGGVNQFWRFERVDSIKPIFRIYTCYDEDLELGHHHGKLKLLKGRKFTWEIEGYFPQ